MPKKGQSPPKQRSKMAKRAPARKKPLSGGGAQPSALPYVSTSGIRTKFDVASRREGSGTILKVHMIDQLAMLPATSSYVGNVSADAIPFSLNHNQSTNTLLGEILPKLQGLASISSRYQVLSARVHYQSTCAASTVGNVGVALAPGVPKVAQSINELASYDHSFVGPFWQNMCTSRWVNAEKRFYHCDSDFVNAELAPFTILRTRQSSVADPTATGLFWLELEIEFTDLRPMPQAGASFKKNTSQVVTGGAAFPANAISWGANTAMDGLWEWTSKKIDTIWDGSTTTQSPKGSCVGTDGLQYLEWFGDLVLSAATVTDTTQMPLLTWASTEEEEKKDIDMPKVFPGPWKQPPRYREICNFRSVQEALRARAEGFRPERVVSALPNAAGDFTANLAFLPSDGTSAVASLATWLVSGGAGAQEYKAQWSGLIDVPGKVFLLVTPTGVESRTLDPTSSMDLTVIDRITSGAP